MHSPFSPQQGWSTRTGNVPAGARPLERATPGLAALLRRAVAIMALVLVMIRAGERSVGALGRVICPVRDVAEPGPPARPVGGLSAVERKAKVLLDLARQAAAARFRHACSAQENSLLARGEVAGAGAGVGAGGIAFHGFAFVVRLALLDVGAPRILACLLPVTADRVAPPLLFAARVLAAALLELAQLAAVCAPAGDVLIEPFLGVLRGAGVVAHIGKALGAQLLAIHHAVLHAVLAVVLPHLAGTAVVD